MTKVIKDTPLMEITLRRYERPNELQNRELVKKFCLSVGLLQPGDSRDVVVDILHVLLEAKKERKELSSEEIKDGAIAFRKDNGLTMLGIASSNVRRQIKRLRDLLLVEKVKNNYRISEFQNLAVSFDEKFQQYLFPSVVSRIREYFQEIDKRFE